MNHCSVSFVRCIKASNPLSAGIFNRAIVLHQLKYTGMLDTLKIRHKGFPFRMEKQAFWDKFHVLVPSVLPPFKQATKGSPGVYDPKAMEAGIQALVPEAPR